MKINIIFASKDLSRASLILEMLSRQGYAVATAHRSREVMGMLAEKSFDMVMVGQNLAALPSSRTCGPRTRISR